MEMKGSAVLGSIPFSSFCLYVGLEPLPRDCTLPFSIFDVACLALETELDFSLECEQVLDAVSCPCAFLFLLMHERLQGLGEAGLSERKLA